ncbi:MAG: nickel pincer cofactor biosynthesis protein LarB [Pseudomonadota bacterium]
MSLSDILEQYKSGGLSQADAEAAITGTFFQNVGGHSTIDTDRGRRTGSTEVVYGEHKTPAQIADLVTAMHEAGQNVMVTRTSAEAYAAVQAVAPDAAFHAEARLITTRRLPVPDKETHVAVVTAGTSDLPIAEEAALTAEFFGSPVARINDVGVAGVHRLLARVEEIREAKVVIVVAGMEGALPSVVGGLVDKPVIAVPTSVGYGASFSGITALLGMLNSCASGVSVVNIDNGFGAGFLANMINGL